MDCYPDTSFLCSLYRKQEHTSKALAVMESRIKPLLVTPFLLLEFRQSVRLQSWLHEKDRSRGYSLFEAEDMLRNLQSDLSAGVLKVLTPDWDDILRISETLSAKHTAVDGHRLADLMHVATALHFGASEFLSFDDRQRRLAESEGMTARP